jgi:thioredoxin reductase (NADPH)
MIVVGGANSAGQAAMFLSRFGSTVTMLVRGGSLNAAMSDYLVKQIAANPKIDVRLRTQLVEARGDMGLQAVVVRDLASGDEAELAAAAMFLLIGAVPHTEFAVGVVQQNHGGFVLTGPDLTRDGRRPTGWRLTRDPYLLETSVPGIFAAGDVRQGAVRRVASAVGEGAVVVSQVHQYLRSV